MKYTKQGDPRSRKSRIFSSRVTFIALASVALLTLVSTSAFMAGQPLPGATWTTNISCGGVNINQYANKDDVYLNGGPNGQGGGPGLPEGYYYVKVTEPDGTLLGTSINGPLGDTPVHVGSNGRFDQCYQLSSIVSPPDAAPNPGYLDTGNNGTVYKYWVCNNSDFSNDNCKTDNFQVDKEKPPPPPQDGTLQIIKFYDANQNGQRDPGEPELAGWKVDVNNGIGTVLTPFAATAAPGTYTATERDTIETNWFASTSKTLTGLVVLNDTTTIKFGNYCELTPGGHTKGFWSNPNGQAQVNAADFTQLTALHLVNLDGSTRDFTGALQANKKNLNTWILSANASNMANQLSAQLAATVLSVNHSYTDATVIVFEGGDVTALIAYAESLLVGDNLTLGGDANRAEQERIKNILDKINNGGSFVQPTPARCPFSFLQ